MYLTPQVSKMAKVPGMLRSCALSFSARRLIIFGLLSAVFIVVFQTIIHPSKGGIIINVLNQVAVTKPRFCEPASSVNYTDILYKRSKSIKPDKGFTVPNVVHYILFNSEPVFELKFFHMLSIISAEKFLKPSAIYFHTNTEPVGEHWTEVKSRVKSLQVVHRNPTSCLFNEPITNPAYETSQSDLDRVLVLMEHGGIYLDLDVLVIRTFDELRKYPCTIGLENPQRAGGAIIVCAAESVFLNLWAEHFVFDYKMWTWAHMSGIVPRLIASHYPDLVHVEPEKLVQPNGDEIEKIWGSEKFDWQQNYALHILWRVWKAKSLFLVNEPNKAYIREHNNTFSQIARRILSD